MFIGAMGFGLSLMFWESWGGLEGSEYDQVALRVRATRIRVNLSCVVD